jgi:hypothetical protein
MWKKTTSLFSKKKGSVIQAVINHVFEEALGFRVSPDHGDGYGTTEEERCSPPWWYEGCKKHVHEVYRTSRAHEGAARATTTIDPFDRATSLHSDILFIRLHHLVVVGGGEALSS